jgi:hypothetical protein
MDIFYNLCNPAQIFASAAIVFVIIRLYSNKNIFMSLSIAKKISVLAVLLLLNVGYTSIVNYSCDSTQNEIAWLLVTIPLLYMLIRLNNR